MYVYTGVRLRTNAVISRFGHQASGRSIAALGWAGTTSAAAAAVGESSWNESVEKELVVGYRSGAVELLNSTSGEVVAAFNALSVTPRVRAAIAKYPTIDFSKRAGATLNAPSALAGVAVLQPSSASQRHLLTCSNSGI